jgi:hypothetical protein
MWERFLDFSRHSAAAGCERITNHDFSEIPENSELPDTRSQRCARDVFTRRVRIKRPS